MKKDFTQRSLNLGEGSRMGLKSGLRDFIKFDNLSCPGGRTPERRLGNRGSTKAER